MRLVKCIDRFPLDWWKFSDSTWSYHFVLTMTARQANRSYLPNIGLFGDFVFPNCNRARHNWAFAFVTSVSRKMEILPFHARIFEQIRLEKRTCKAPSAPATRTPSNRRNSGKRRSSCRLRSTEYLRCFALGEKRWAAGLSMSTWTRSALPAILVTSCLRRSI